jgi:hypothetical protein
MGHFGGYRSWAPGEVESRIANSTGRTEAGGGSSGRSKIRVITSIAAGAHAAEIDHSPAVLEERR